MRCFGGEEMPYDDYKLALDAFNRVLNSLKGEAKSKFRSRARDLVEEIYTSGFIPTLFYIISKAGLENNDKIDKLTTLLNSPSSESIDLGSSDEASYMAYLFVILYYLSERNIIDKKFLIDKLRCNRLELIDKLYELSPIISARLKRYLMAIKRLAEAIIEVR